MAKKLLAILLITMLFFPVIHGFTMKADVYAQQQMSEDLALGSFVQFGRYEDKPIVWQVIHKDSNGTVLFAKDIISYKAFDAKGDKADGRDSRYNSRVLEGSNYWTKSNLREWLNSNEQVVNYSHQKPDAANTLAVTINPWGGQPYGLDVSYDQEAGFLTNFFDDELSAIQSIQHKVYLSEFDTMVKDGGSKVYSVEGDNSNAWYQWVTDRVFLLSASELLNWVYNNDAYQELSKGYVFPNTNGATGYTYWLRSPEPISYASTVLTGDVISRHSSLRVAFNAYRPAGVRPVIYLKPGYAMSGPGTVQTPYVVRTSYPSGWADEEVTKAIANNLVDQKLQSAYQQDITRAEFCSLAVKLYEALSGRTAQYDLVTPFSDTNDIDVRKAYKLGIVQGVGANRFAPNNNITREQIAVMFYRTLEAVKNARPDINLETTHKISFYDNNEISNWAVKAVTFMNHERIILGTGTGFNPKGTATREQTFLLANRTYEKYKK